MQQAGCREGHILRGSFGFSYFSKWETELMPVDALPGLEGHSTVSACSDQLRLAHACC
jgi:hypothetical protein